MTLTQKIINAVTLGILKGKTHSVTKQLEKDPSVRDSIAKYKTAHTELEKSIDRMIESGIDVTPQEKARWLGKI